MLFLNEELFNSKTQLDCFMSRIESNIKSNIKTLLMYKSILLNYILKIATLPDSNDNNNADQTISFLSKCKYFLSLNSKAIENVKFLQNNYNNLKSPYKLEELQNYYNTYNEKLDEIVSAQLELINFFVEASDILSYKIPEQKSNENTLNNLNDNSIIPIENTSQNLEIDIPKETENEKQQALDIEATDNFSKNSSSDYPENTLIISEVSGTVLLPYYKDELNKLVNNESTDINDLIRKHYIIPIEKYKYPVLSRFKEAFKLMRNIEKRSIVEAIDLAMELSFNSNLHPAIISACRNLNELDIYLDYLDNNQTEKFNCFSIKFEILPIKMQ